MKGKATAWLKGKPKSEEHRRKIGEAQKGKHFSEETKRKISEAVKGNKHTEEWKINHSAAVKGENNPMYGKHHSEETKRKLSEAHKGKHHSEETRKKISEAKKDRPSPKKGKKYVFYKCVETGEIGTINDWNKRKFYHVNYGRSKGLTFKRVETVPSVDVEKTIKTKEEI